MSYICKNCGTIYDDRGFPPQDEFGDMFCDMCDEYAICEADTCECGETKPADEGVCVECMKKYQDIAYKYFSAIEHLDTFVVEALDDYIDNLFTEKFRRERQQKT